MWEICKWEEERIRGMRVPHQESWEKNGLFTDEWRNISVESLNRDDIVLQEYRPANCRFLLGGGGEKY